MAAPDKDYFLHLVNKGTGTGIHFCLIPCSPLFFSEREFLSVNTQLNDHPYNYVPVSEMKLLISIHTAVVKANASLHNCCACHVLPVSVVDLGYM